MLSGILPFGEVTHLLAWVSYLTLDYRRGVC